MRNEQLAALIEAIRKGPPPVIGFDYNSPSQNAFDMGWNAAKDQIWQQMQALGLTPHSDAEEDGDGFRGMKGKTRPFEGE